MPLRPLTESVHSAAARNKMHQSPAPTNPTISVRPRNERLFIGDNVLHTLTHPTMGTIYILEGIEVTFANTSIDAEITRIKIAIVFTDNRMRTWIDLLPRKLKAHETHCQWMCQRRSPLIVLLGCTVTKGIDAFRIKHDFQSWLTEQLLTGS